MAKKKKKKKKRNVSVPIKFVDKPWGSRTPKLDFYPGSGYKTVWLTWQLSNPNKKEYKGKVTTYTITWLVRPVGAASNDFRTAGTSTSSASGVSYDFPSNCVELKATVKPTGFKSSSSYNYSGKGAESNVVANKNAEKVTQPSTPELELDQTKTTLTIKILNYVDSSPAHTTTLACEVSTNDGNPESKGNATVKNGIASWTHTVGVGNRYKARVKAIGNSSVFTTDSEWSAWSDNVYTPPEAPNNFTASLSSTLNDNYTVLTSWSASTGATSYEVQYTDVKAYFDTGDYETATVEAPTTKKYITSNLTAGKTWYFRVIALIENEKSEPSNEKSVIVGEPPAAPTTWSYESVLMINQPAVLCWTHNSKDGSFMQWAYIEWRVPGGSSSHAEVRIKDQNGRNQDASTDESNAVSTYSYKLSTSGFSDGNEVYWKVKTKGVMPSYGPFSTERKFIVYAPPTLGMLIRGTNGDASSVTGSSMDNEYGVINEFPVIIDTASGPSTQTPIGIQYQIISEDDYDVSIGDGTEVHVTKGEVIYSRYVTVSSHNVTLTLNPGDLFLESCIHYTVSATVGMSNGLTATATAKFYPVWADSDYSLDADVVVDPENLIAYIRPFCINNETEREIKSGMLLSIYRREVNGSFDKVSENLDVANNYSIVDVHPALDYARYRIVGINKTTGKVIFEDLPGTEVGEKGIAIHWSEAWRSIDEGYADFDSLIEGADDFKMGSLLKLPYNVDVSDDMGKEASLINYAGRTYPVSYYGTQRTLTSKWSTQIDKNDAETLNSIRRLAMYGGDSYVREPNGTGYWAALTLSYSISHDSPLVSVDFNMTRVEGGEGGIVTEQPIEVEEVEQEEPAVEPEE